MYSLFRTETLDGTVSYHDVDRAYFINIEEPSDTFRTNHDFLDKMFPITMPYMPEKGRYKVYVQTFLVDKKHGDFDTRGIFYVITPSGEKNDVNIFMTEGDDGKMHQISKEEYEVRLAMRIDKVSQKVANNLLWTLISNSSLDDETDRREEKWKSLDEGTRANLRKMIEYACRCFNKEEFWQYNTFSIHQALCGGQKKVYENVPELVSIAGKLELVLKELER